MQINHNTTTTTKTKQHHVLILLTGGTLGMRRNKNSGSLEPTKGHLQTSLYSLLHYQDGSKKNAFPLVTVYEFPTPLDSSDMEPNDWTEIATHIYNSYNDYDGFVVVMGTDTMVYCGCALSFMLKNLHKTVILTGAMLPMDRGESDAQRNLLLSIQIAPLGIFPEVIIVFHNLVLRANRAKKIASDELQAFESPNLPPLATVGAEMLIRQSVIRKLSPSIHNEPLILQTQIERSILCLKLVPGFALDAIFFLFATSPLKAIVLELYGSGNAPRKIGFVEAVRTATQRGVVVAVVSQCPKGWVNLEAYSNGRQLLDAGAISAGDMTLESTVVKLGYLFGLGLNRDQVITQMKTNICGELSEILHPEARFEEKLVVRSVL
jgi:L-asparaginase